MENITVEQCTKAIEAIYMQQLAVVFYLIVSIIFWKYLFNKKDKPIDYSKEPKLLEHTINIREKELNELKKIKSELIISNNKN